MIEGLSKSIEIIDEEMKVARELNPIMAMGMSQIRMLISRELDKEKEKIKNNSED